MTTLDVSVIGLGLMGRAIAERLIETGHSVAGYNRSPLQTPLENAKLVDTPAEAVRTSRITWLMLSDAEACTRILTDCGDALQDRWILNGSTIGPEQSRRLAEQVQAAGGHYAETPVLGSIPQARSGTLQILLGGSEDALDATRSVLDTLGTPERFGDVGAGAVVKLSLNQLIGSLTAAFSMSLGLVQKEGVDVDQFMATLRESALYAPTFDKKLDNMRNRAFNKANFPLQHLLKDIRLFTRAAARHEIDNHMLIGLQHVLEEGVYDGHAKHDYSSLYEEIVPRSSTD